MSTNYNVLLVEDLEDDVFLFRKALGALPGFKLAGCAGTGEAAIAYLTGEAEFGDRQQYPWPDIMVLDLKLPGKDGFEVLEWLRKRARRPRVGVFTSSDLPEDKQKADRLGADLYEVKTYEREQFGKFMHWLARLVDEDQKGKNEFKNALIGGVLIEVLGRCA